MSILLCLYYCLSLQKLFFLLQGFWYILILDCSSTTVWISEVVEFYVLIFI